MSSLSQIEFVCRRVVFGLFRGRHQVWVGDFGTLPQCSRDASLDLRKERDRTQCNEHGIAVALNHYETAGIAKGVSTVTSGTVIEIAILVLAVSTVSDAVKGE